MASSTLLTRRFVNPAQKPATSSELCITDTDSAYEAIDENSKLIVRIIELEAAFAGGSTEEHTAADARTQRKVEKLKDELGKRLAVCAKWSDEAPGKPLPPLAPAERTAARVALKNHERDLLDGQAARSGGRAHATKRARQEGRRSTGGAAASDVASSSGEFKGLKGEGKSKKPRTAPPSAGAGAGPGFGVEEGGAGGETKFRGLCRVGRRWKAQITYSGTTHHLGMFASQEEAARAYDASARLHHSNASLNFPDGAGTDQGNELVPRT